LLAIIIIYQIHKWRIYDGTNRKRCFFKGCACICFSRGLALKA